MIKGLFKNENITSLFFKNVKLNMFDPIFRLKLYLKTFCLTFKNNKLYTKDFVHEKLI